MPRTSQLQTSFNAGELSPTLLGRVDFEPFLQGSSILENFSNHPQGWIFRRKGLKFINEVKNSTKLTRLIPFKFNVDQVLIIELGAGYFRFYLNQSLVTSGGVYEVANPFIESDLRAIRFIQKDDVVYLLHPLRGLFKLIRLANNNWTFSTVDLLKGPHKIENIISTNSVTITGTYTKGGTTTLTATGGHTPFTANHVGGLWKVREGTDYAFLKITNFISSTVVTCVNQEAVPATLQGIAKFTWSEGEFSLARSFPRAIIFHEQRLVLAGSINESQKIWFSRSGDFENFQTDPVLNTANAAFDRTIAANSNDSIVWLFSDQVLLIGTSEGIWNAKPSNNSAGLSNSDISLKRNVAFGSAELSPVYADDSPFYLQRGKQKIRSLAYAFSKDKYQAEDITIRSDHITGTGIIEFAYQQNPISTIYALREDGQVGCFTYEAQQEVGCWARLKTDGIVESMATIPTSSNYDEIYFIVKRVINGVSKRYIEVIEPTFKYDVPSLFYVDSGLTYDGRKNATLTLGNTSPSFVLVTENGIVLVNDNQQALVTEKISLTITSDIAIFSPSDVGKRIHEYLTGFGKAKILSYISNTSVVIDIIENFSSSTLLPNQWGIAVNKVGGLTHLIGKTISIAGDGATFPNQVIDGFGEVFFNDYSLIVHAGLPYESIRASMPIEATRLQGVLGNSTGKLKRFDDVIIKFANTRGGIILDSTNKIYENLARSLIDNMNEAPTFLTGDRKINLNSDWDRLGLLTIKQIEPQPMNIQCLTYYISINDN